MILLLAAIAFVQGVKQDCTTGPSCGSTVTSCQATITVGAGHQILAHVTYDSTGGGTPTGVADSGGDTLTLLSTATVSGLGQNVKTYGIVSATSSTTVTVSLSAGNDGVQILVEEYSGALAFGATNTAVNQTGATTESIALTLQQANNWLVGGYFLEQVTTASGGTTKRVEQLTLCGGAFPESFVAGDNTAASTTSVAVSYTSAAASWGGTLTELCLSNPCVAAGAATPVYNQRSRRGH